jgi:hypothetical protein
MVEESQEASRDSHILILKLTIKLHESKQCGTGTRRDV